MLEGRVVFTLLGDDASEDLPQEVRKKFVAVMQTATWEFKSRLDRVLYHGLVVIGPKALPGTEFRCVAEVLTAAPPGGIDKGTLADLMKIVSDEYRKHTLLMAE